MLEWLTNRKKLALAQERQRWHRDNATRRAERAEHWMTQYYALREVKDRLDLELSASVGREMSGRLDVERLQSHAVRLYGDCQFSNACLADTQADIEKLQTEAVEARGHVRNGDDNIQRLEAERDEAWQEATGSGMGSRDAWQQTAGELQAGIDRRERTIERQEARIKALAAGLAFAQKNDKRGPDGRFRKV